MVPIAICATSGTKVLEGYRVLKNDTMVVAIRLEVAAELSMSAHDMDRRSIAKAGYILNDDEQLRERDTWKVTVKPAVDAVLILACFLAIIRFTSWKETGTLTSGNAWREEVVGHSES